MRLLKSAGLPATTIHTSQGVSLLKVMRGMLSLPITAFLGWFPQDFVICLIIHFFREHPEVPDTTKVHYINE